MFSADEVFAGVLSASLADRCNPVTIGSVQHLLETAERTHPDAVVAHLVPGESRSVIGELASCAPVLVVGPDDEDAMLAAVESGASGYALQGGSLEAISEAAQSVSEGRAVVPPLMLGSLLRAVVRRGRRQRAEQERLTRLTPRERQILDLVVCGKNRKEIARELIISPETARTHIQRIMGKLGLHSRAEVVAFGARGGLDMWGNEE